ncbi:MAG: glycosyltransferase family 2 protein [Propionibacteriaceae bacterium]|nr:glycosyltransferase family 2 protein [Micropruina sp.]HBX79756.1 glycosyltransferase [Propionibacteriaceae bacterium]HBY24597.1 glycosyltransferase [Propionibacteriaceae bacterium]
MNLSVVIPCYRSRDTLVELVSRLHASLPAIADDYEIILVVDGSPDDTFAVARALEREDDRVNAVLLRRNFGQHHASLAGIARARFEVTVLMDDDLQHRPEEIHKLLAPLNDPTIDVVYGNAVDEEHRLLRNWTSQGVKILMERMGVRHARLFSSFLAFRTSLRAGFVQVLGEVYIDVLLSWTTNEVIAVPVTMDQRSVGSSGYTWGSLLNLTWDMTTGSSTVPLRLVTGAGIASFIAGLVILAAILGNYWAHGPDVPGWTSQAGMTAAFSGLMMLSIGIVGEYLGRLHIAAMRRPTYLVRVQGGLGPIVGTPGAVLDVTATTDDADALAEALRKRYAGSEQATGT